MPRVARPIDLERLSHLRIQIGDPSYIESAVERLAGRITEHLLDLDRQELALPPSQNGDTPQHYMRANDSSMKNTASRSERL